MWKKVISWDLIILFRWRGFPVKCLPNNMQPLYGSSILKLGHKTDNGTRSSDHSHQRHGEVQPGQQKACHRQSHINKTKIWNYRMSKNKSMDKNKMMDTAEIEIQSWAKLNFINTCKLTWVKGRYTFCINLVLLCLVGEKIK